MLITAKPKKNRLFKGEEREPVMHSPFKAYN